MIVVASKFPVQFSLIPARIAAPESFKLAELASQIRIFGDILLDSLIYPTSPGRAADKVGCITR